MGVEIIRIKAVLSSTGLELELSLATILGAFFGTPFSTKLKLIMFVWFGSVSKQHFIANLGLLLFKFYKIYKTSIYFMVFNFDWINASFASVRFANC